MKTKYTLLFVLLSLVLSACMPVRSPVAGPDLSKVGSIASVSIVSATASPASVVYPYNCGTIFVPPVDITFTVLVNDPSGIGSEHYDVRIRFAFGSLPSPGEDFMLAQAGTTGTVYTYSDDTADAESLIPSKVMSAAFATGASGSFLWDAAVNDESMRVLARTGVMEIPFAPGACPTPLAIPPGKVPPGMPPLTPASAADCPSGTYYADMTHQCIAIATPTATKQTKCVPNQNNGFHCP